MMNANHHICKEDLLKEYNLNYKNYLENLLIYQLVYEIISEKKEYTNSSQSKSNELNEKQINRFWKTYLLTNNVNNENQANNSENENLNNRNETSLTGLSATSAAASVSLLSTTSQSSFNSLMPQFNSLTTSTSQRRTSNININHDYLLSSQLKLTDLNDSIKKDIISNLDKRLDDVYIEKLFNFIKKDIDVYETNKCTALTDKIKEVIHSNDMNSKQIDALNNEISIKLKSFFNLISEIVANLTRLLHEYKLDFYLNKNSIQFERSVHKCEMLLAKIDTILGECVYDTYLANNKLHGLKCIRQQININSIKLKDKYEKMKNALSLYKSMGSEFDSIHKSYIELKQKLENRKWTLNKMKNDCFYE